MSETTPPPRYHARRQLAEGSGRPPNSSSTSNSALPPYLDNGAVQFDSSSIAVTALVLFSALFFLGFFSVFLRRYCTDDFNPRGHPPAGLSRHPRFFSPGAQRGLDQATVRALPLLPYNAQKDSRDCVVCLGEFQGGEVVKVIPCCGHFFHPPCIDSWLLAHASCPLCRSTKLFVPESKLKGISGGSPPPPPAPAPAPAPAVDGETVEVVVVGREEEGGVVERDLSSGGCSVGMGRSRSWCCLVVGEKDGDESPRRSCSL